jgi:hypothetical protein
VIELVLLSNTATITASPAATCRVDVSVALVEEVAVVMLATRPTYVMGAANAGSAAPAMKRRLPTKMSSQDRVIAGDEGLITGSWVSPWRGLVEPRCAPRSVNPRRRWHGDPAPLPKLANLRSTSRIRQELLLHQPSPKIMRGMQRSSQRFVAKKESKQEMHCKVPPAVDGKNGHRARSRTLRIERPCSVDSRRSRSFSDTTS